MTGDLIRAALARLIAQDSLEAPHAEDAHAELDGLLQRLQDAGACERDMDAEIQRLKAWEPDRELRERIEAAEARVDGLLQREQELTQALTDAIEHAAAGWAYADEYFWTKWQAAEEFDRLRAALAAVADPGGQG